MKNQIKNAAAVLTACLVVFCIVTCSIVPSVQAQKKRAAKRVAQNPVPTVIAPSGAKVPDLMYYVDQAWDKGQRGNGMGEGGLIILNTDPQVKGGLWWFKDHPEDLPDGFTVEQLTVADTGPDGIICGDMMSMHRRNYGYRCIDLTKSAKGGEIYVLKYHGEIVAVVNCGNAFHPYGKECPECKQAAKCEPNTDRDSWTMVDDDRDEDGVGTVTYEDNCKNLHFVEYKAVRGNDVTTVVCIGGYVYDQPVTLPKREGETVGRVLQGFEVGWDGSGKLGKKRFKVEDELAKFEAQLRAAGFDPTAIVGAARAGINREKAVWLEIGINPCDFSVRVRFFDKKGVNWFRIFLLVGLAAAAIIIGVAVTGHDKLIKTTNGIPPRIQPPGRSVTNTGP
jgi:hypothetical protein